ncbi:titin isoform X2 [Hemibagrus wyckioides]|uniref:titin isoform X2 n=1 Tax=Hemibagrus wyckioides TaxID=337641 RepID=UPI00266B748C|nr:titin isoform X2 [Hemibagrus wyckioides]
MVSALHTSDQMIWPVWLILFSCSISITPSQSELVFSVQPKDGVGVLNSPLMLHCAVYDTTTQTGLPVKWERWRIGNGGLAAGVHQMANGSLFFSWLKEEDLGRYVCSARKGTKQIRNVVTVSKAYLENVFFSPQSQSVIKGQDVFFQCVSGDSSPPAHISWLKNSKAFNRGTQIQGQYGGGSQRKTSGTLHLTNVTKEDQGHYVCVTHNPLLNMSKESGTATLIVGGHSMSLEIIQGPENITVAVEMATAMHCVVRGFPTPKVQWFKDDQVLSNTSRWDLHDDGQLLVFGRVLPEDEGFYYCEANNDKERLRSQSAYLLPAVMDWTFVLQPVNKTVRKGDSVTLHCSPPHSRPPAQITWFRNNQLLQSRSHISAQATGDLLFHSVQETDRGSYFCRASNSFLQRSITSRMIFLEVLAPPSVTIWPLAVISAVGAEVVIQCQVSGHPDPSIEWSKSGQSVRTGGKITKGVRNATLYISSVRIYDEGFYTCAASNTVGQDKKTIRLQIAAKPVIVLFSGSVNVSKGANIILPCQAVGNPPLKYSWHRSALQTPLSLSSRIRIDDNETLHISNAHQSDAGEYYCIAENNLGQDRRKTTITVFSADPEEDFLSTIPEIKPEDPTNPTNEQNLKSYRGKMNLFNSLYLLFVYCLSNVFIKVVSDCFNFTSIDIYLKNSPTHSISVPTPFSSYTSVTDHDNASNTGVTQKYKDLSSTPGTQLVFPYSKILETRTQKRHVHVTPTNLITQHKDEILRPSHIQPESLSAQNQTFNQISLQGFSEQHTSSQQDHSSHSSVVQALELTQTSGFTLYDMNSVTSAAPVEVHQFRSQPAEQLTVTKASQANNTELLELLNKNTSKAPMRTTDNNAREKRKSQSWLPVLEKHDIPIVVGVGVSLAFIFITMAFYSLFRKNDPVAVTTGRAALRGLGGPCRHGERLAIERTYDNKAFEDDNMVAVIEQSPNTSEMRAHPPTSSPSTLLMEPSYDDTQEDVQPSQDMPVIVETHSEPSEEEQLETSFEESKATPSLPSDAQLQCMEDWRSQDLGQCQRDAPLPPSSNPLGSQEEGLRSSLTLQTSDSSSTPVHHSISLSHASCPLLLSHCVTLGMTSVSVDVHFYPSNPTQYGSLRPPSNSQHEHDQNARSTHHGKS